MESNQIKSFLPLTIEIQKIRDERHIPYATEPAKEEVNPMKKPFIEKTNLHKKSKFTLDDIGEKLNTLIKQNNSLMKKLQKQKEQILDLKKDFHRLETQQQQMKEEIAHLKATSQQKNLNNNSVISGIDAKNMNDTQIKGNCLWSKTKCTTLKRELRSI
ncbi:hypothetical protein HHI36_017907 [Cryptolaemus montrouzieri]|uniref:Uncharacterized protein n=1 Tax=Cryptolaemus montrouzieri TaxID=559131 RepID=A0ABD2NP62_9CUCU